MLRYRKTRTLQTMLHKISAKSLNDFKETQSLCFEPWSFVRTRNVSFETLYGGQFTLSTKFGAAYKQANEQ